MILVDVGAWLALVYEAHARSEAVCRWKSQVEDGLVMCRVTQMSLLRLLTNRTVMRDDVLTRVAAWDVMDRLEADGQITFSMEPEGVEPLWRSLSARDELSHKLWTDDYLAAFALAGRMQFATLDRKIAGRYPAVHVVTIN